MLQLTIIILCSLIILLPSLFFSEDGILTPRASYAFAFLPSSLLLCLYIKKWDIDLDYRTVLVIISGLLIFTGISLAVERIKLKDFKLFIKKRESLNLDEEMRKEGKEIALWKYIFFIIFQLATLYLLYKYIVSIVGAGSFGSVMNAIRQKTVAEYINIPTIISIMRSISIASGYVWIYLLLYMLIHRIKRYKTRFLLMGNIILSIIISILLGGRGNLIETIVIGWLLYYVISGTKEDKKERRKLRKKCYIYAILFGILGILTFQSLGRIVGRNLKYDNLDYFAVYLSAPIKNLDIFIKESEGSVSVFSGISKGLDDNQTLSTILNYIAIKFQITDLYHTRDLTNKLWPDRRINGYYLGNCYTAYASYLYDGGWIAVFTYIFFHAAFCQLLYKAIVRKKIQRSNETAMVLWIVYCKIWYYTFFTFFTHMFYFTCFGVGFIRTIIYLIAIKWFLYNVNIGSRYTE